MEVSRFSYSINGGGCPERLLSNQNGELSRGVDVPRGSCPGG